MSSLGQPLRAEIELTSVSNDEAGALTVKLAPADAFRLANIEFNPALLSLQFSVEQRNGRQYIKIGSTQPVNEPFVDMLLELSWNNGRLVREYTFLLDPAELRATQTAQVAAPVDVLSQGNKTSMPAPSAAAVPARAPARPAAEPKPAHEAGTASEYKVKPGDTLGRVAAQLKPVDISLDMMLVALYRANPDAFAGNNMNRLKSGTILAVPDADALHGADGGEAHGVVVAHAADFNAYRSKLAGQVASAAPAKSPEASQSAGGKISAKVQEHATPANEARDQLKLSKASAGNGARNATANVEDKIARDKALTEATARVKELEKNVNDLEKLMTVKTKAGADMKKAAETLPAKPPAPASAAVKPAPPKAAPAKPAPPAPGLLDMLMENITTIGAGLAVLLLGGVGLVAARRKKEGAKSPTEPSILGAPTDQAHSLFAETGGQSVDTNNSVFNSSFAPSASQLDTNEVDPVAEADVYIAYGRDAQAEEILKEALRTHPERMPVRLKLLEIYASRKDQRAFENQASEMYGMSKGQGDDWAQAAALGLSIDPLNPLYANAAAPAPAPAPTAAEQEQQAMLTQQLDDALAAESGMDMDLGLSGEATALPQEPAAKPADDSSLDFDLGGLSFEPITHGAPIAMPGPTPAAAPVPDMEFTSAPVAPAEPVKTVDEESFDMAFDMAFDTPAAPAAPVTPSALDDISLDLVGEVAPAPAAGLDFAMDLDLPATPAAAPTPDPLDDIDSMSFDLPSTPAAPDPLADFGLPELPVAAEAVPSHTPAAPHFDMSSIDLDLPATDSLDSALPDFPMDQAPDGAEMSAVHMEMETKLDLAIAYQEIGDKEGARELLDEVIKGGNGDQITKANAMRAKLG
ncbi:MAG: FimV/HubP family polar landmark protein [Pseudomonadota bacterium]